MGFVFKEATIEEQFKTEFIHSKVDETLLDFDKLCSLRGTVPTTDDGMVGLSRPSQERIKINVDGATSFVRGLARLGCVARDHNDT